MYDKLDELISDIEFYGAYDYSVDRLIADPAFATDGLTREEIDEALILACDFVEELDQFAEAFYY